MRFLATRRNTYEGIPRRSLSSVSGSGISLVSQSTTQTHVRRPPPPPRSDRLPLRRSLTSGSVTHRRSISSLTHQSYSRSLYSSKVPTVPLARAQTSRVLPPHTHAPLSSTASKSPTSLLTLTRARSLSPSSRTVTHTLPKPPRITLPSGHNSSDIGPRNTDSPATASAFAISPLAQATSRFDFSTALKRARTELKPATQRPSPRDRANTAGLVSKTLHRTNTGLEPPVSNTAGRTGRPKKTRRSKSATADFWERVVSGSHARSPTTFAASQTNTPIGSPRMRSAGAAPPRSPPYKSALAPRKTPEEGISSGRPGPPQMDMSRRSRSVEPNSRRSMQSNVLKRVMNIESLQDASAWLQGTRHMNSESISDQPTACQAHETGPSLSASPSGHFRDSVSSPQSHNLSPVRTPSAYPRHQTRTNVEPQEPGTVDTPLHEVSHSARSTDQQGLRFPHGSPSTSTEREATSSVSSNSHGDPSAENLKSRRSSGQTDVSVFTVRTEYHFEAEGSMDPAFMKPPPASPIVPRRDSGDGSVSKDDADKAEAPLVPGSAVYHHTNMKPNANVHLGEGVKVKSFAPKGMLRRDSKHGRYRTVCSTQSLSSGRFSCVIKGFSRCSEFTRLCELQQVDARILLMFTLSQV